MYGMTKSAEKYNSGAHSKYLLQAHIVLTVKYRKRVFTDLQILEFTAASIVGVCERVGVSVLEINGEADHIHLLVSYPPHVALSRLIGSIKANSSREIREQRFSEVRRLLWGDYFWSPSYFVVSAGGAPINVIREYIQSQRTPKKMAQRYKS